MDGIFSTSPGKPSIEEMALHIILIGPPGVGKGSQAKRLCARARLAHLSTGELLREEIAAGSELGLRVRESVESGGFADDDTVLQIVIRRMKSPDCARGCVMDGFPRNLHQARRFDEILAGHGFGVSRVLLIEAPEEDILERLTGRRVCSGCGDTYHTVLGPPQIDGVCDACGEEVVQREDDAPATQRERLRIYRDQTEPLIDYYRATGALESIDGSGSKDEVTSRIVGALPTA